MSPYEDAERLMTECEHLRGLLSKQQAVVDAALEFTAAEDRCDALLDAEPFDNAEHCVAMRELQTKYQTFRETLRALDGEP
jgi:hypothetical protein